MPKLFIHMGSSGIRCIPTSGTGTNSGQVLKWSGSGGPSLLVPVGCQNGGLCAVSDVAATADGTMIASDFTDDQIVSFDTLTGAVTASAPLERAGVLAGGLDKTAFGIRLDVTGQQQPMIAGLYRHDAGRRHGMPGIRNFDDA